MPTRPQTRWPWIGVIAAAAVLAVAAWRLAGPSLAPGRAPANAILVIAPYDYQGTWVFDDPAVGLTREPFVAGVPEMIDVLVRDIPDAKRGFRLLFSAREFPGCQKRLTWLRGDKGATITASTTHPSKAGSAPPSSSITTPRRSIYT